MRRASILIAGVTLAAPLAPLTWQQYTVAQAPPTQSPAAPAPGRRSDQPQPAGDAVAPTAGEKKSPTDAPSERNPQPQGARVAVTRGTVHTLRLPELQSELPPGPGRETAVVMCAVCHSTRYITIQPPLSRETWLAEVTKMQKTFGAPIPDDKVPELVNYLVSVRGPQAK